MVTRKQAQLRLAGAEWLARPELQRIFAVLDGEKKRTRAVGGVVRDTLLARHRDDSDIDLATELPPQEVMARAEAAGISAYPTGIDHGTVTLKLGPQVVEVTTLREDVETDGRHAVVRFGSDWERDAQRRDFTMNALYAEADGTLFDPVGGIADCISRRVRFIGDPDQRIAEDRLRVYRFFRFSASYGDEQFDPAGLEACRRAAHALSSLSAERIGSEMLKLLGAPRVARSMAEFDHAGIFETSLVTRAVLERYDDLPASPLPLARIAILMREQGGDLQARWRLSNSLTQGALNTNAASELVAGGGHAEAAYRYPGLAEPGALVAAAVNAWPHERLKAVLSEIRSLGPPRFPVSGADLLGLGMQPGRLVGLELARLERLWIDSGFALDRDQLLSATRL